MACANGVGWCKGVGGFGNLCTACQKGGVKPAGGVVAPSLPGFKMPVAKVVAMPALGGIPALPMGGAAAAVVVAPLVLGPPRQVTVYRGDTREPGELKKLGFELWGEAIANVSKVGGIANYILMKCRELKTGATFADFVRVGKDQGRPTISTSANQGCGGYASGYIYKIEYPALHEYDLTPAILPPSAGPMVWNGGELKVYMDGATLQLSRTIVIDLHLGTEEWAFFTKVPPERITAYKAAGAGAFVSMAGVVAVTKKLW